MQGGVGAYSQIMARQFAHQGHEVYVLSSQQAQEIQPQIHLDTLSNWSITTLIKIRRWAQTQKLDIINLQFETAAYSMSPWIHFLPQMVNIPVVTTFHDLLFPYLFPKAGRLRNWIVMHLARVSAGVIATNHEDMEKLNHLSRVRLISIGSNINRVFPPDFDAQSWREKLGAAPDDLLIAYFGFINHSKGVDTLLQAAAELAQHNFPFRLLMIGGRTGSSDPTNASYADEIDQLIDQLGLAPSIHWTGFADDAAVTAYLQASDVVILPFRDGASYRRGTLMAAIDHGCPIITTQPKVDIPAFKSGENMLLVPPEDPKALADAIHRFRGEGTELRIKLSKGALELSKHFDWSLIAQDTLALFEHILGEHR